MRRISSSRGRIRKMLTMTKMMMMIIIMLMMIAEVLVVESVHFSSVQ